MMFDSALAPGLEYSVRLPEKLHASHSFSIQPLRENGDTLSFRAEAYIKRRVRQGEPDRFLPLVGGVHGFGFEWTDGVHSVATWIVAPYGTGVVIQYCGGKKPRKRGEALLSGLVWRRVL